MPYTRTLSINTGKTSLLMESSVVSFDVIAESRSGIFVELFTEADESSPEARYMKAASLQANSRGHHLLIPTPDSVTVHGPGGSISISGGVQFNVFGRSHEASSVVFQHGIEAMVRVPVHSDLGMQGKAGSLLVRGHVGHVWTELTGGSVTFDKATSLNVRTSGGKIEGNWVGGTAAVHTSGGSIEIGAILGAVQLDTSGGDIRVGRVDGDGYMETSGGDVRLERFEGSHLRLHTSGGDIRHPEHPGISANTSGGRVNGQRPRW